jgi:hypothetical protein
MTVTNPAVAPVGVTLAAGPTGLTQTVNADGSVSLSWVAVPGATGYTVIVDGTVNFAVKSTRTNYMVPASTLITLGGTNHKFSVTAQTLSGTTASTATAAYTGVAYPPVAVSAVAGTVPGTITLNWANDPRNVNNVTGYTLGWNYGGTVNRTLATTTTGATVIRLKSGTSYTFTLVAEGANNNGVNLSSPSVTLGPVIAP